MSNISFFAEHTGNCNDWTVEQCLESALARLRSGDLTADRVLILFVEDEPEVRGFTIHQQRARLDTFQEMAVMTVQWHTAMHRAQDV